MFWYHTTGSWLGKWQIVQGEGTPPNLACESGSNTIAFCLFMSRIHLLVDLSLGVSFSSSLIVHAVSAWLHGLLNVCSALLRPPAWASLPSLLFCGFPAPDCPIPAMVHHDLSSTLSASTSPSFLHVFCFPLSAYDKLCHDIHWASWRCGVLPWRLWSAVTPFSVYSTCTSD